MEDQTNTPAPSTMSSDKSAKSSLRFRDGLVYYEDIKRKGGFMVTHTLFGTTAATAANYNHFFTAPRACEILEISEVHATAGTDASDVRLTLELLAPGIAKTNGELIPKTTFDLKSTINTPVSKSGFDLSEFRVVPAGYRVGLNTAGVLTAVANLSVTLYVKFYMKGDFF